MALVVRKLKSIRCDDLNNLCFGFYTVSLSMTYYLFRSNDPYVIAF